MRTFAASLLLFCLAASCTAQILPTPPPGAPVKPVWPLEFDSPFGLNWSLQGKQLIVNATSHLYYDYNVQAQLLDYPERCFPEAALHSGDYPCKMLFIPSGIYLMQPQNGIECCVIAPNVGTVPPEFLRAFVPKDVQTVPDMYGNEYSCNHWVSGGGFAYWTSVDGGLDIQFKDDDTGVFWNFGAFNVAPQDPSMFVLPYDNCTAPCLAPGQEALYRPYQHLLQHMAGQ